VIVAYIDAHKARFGIEPICAVLSEHDIPIAASTYHARHLAAVTDAEWDDAQAANLLLDLWRQNWGVYGIDKCQAAMYRAGHRIGRDHTHRLMAILGISGATRGRHRTITTRQDDKAPRHPDLIGRAWDTPTRPDQWWVADFTYVWTVAGFVYTSFVTDVYSRRILGWRVSTSKTTPLVTAALDQALFTRRRHNARFTSTGLVFHSDAGSQYTAIAFTDALAEAGVAPSIGTVGDALDNALMESTIGLYKTELINRARSWTGTNDVERETANWVHWFNTDRLHTSIGMLPPIEYEDLYLQAQLTPPAAIAV
jgi:putative transposase